MAARRVPKLFLLNGSHDRETSASAVGAGPMRASDVRVRGLGFASVPWKQALRDVLCCRRRGTRHPGVTQVSQLTYEGGCVARLMSQGVGTDAVYFSKVFKSFSLEFEGALE